MRNISVLQNGEIISIQEESILSDEEAILKAQEDWLYYQFGQAGALTEKDIQIENKFLKSTFTIEILND